MIETECEVKKWGNSLGIVIPKEAAEQIQLKAEQKIKVLIEKPKTTKAKELFGAIKLKKPTGRLMAEMDKALDI
jgi:antitoxin component of MazEF toxin-antitoxin module